MKIVLIISIIIVLVVLLLAVLTTSKAYTYKHTVDPVEDNPNIQKDRTNDDSISHNQ
ncbi:YtzI protein [Bacillus massilinigeriensis]|uniref:YtzI protein n=1 Tax=Bacillus massilionigeriensis TaxID=1805475 RepID=UPI00096B655E|nr:YtzI protein [Bacillus massilionigeriensis]